MDPFNDLALQSPIDSDACLHKFSTALLIAIQRYSPTALEPAN